MFEWVKNRTKKPHVTILHISRQRIENWWNSWPVSRLKVKVRDLLQALVWPPNPRGGSRQGWIQRSGNTGLEDGRLAGKVRKRRRSRKTQWKGPKKKVWSCDVVLCCSQRVLCYNIIQFCYVGCDGLYSVQCVVKNEKLEKLILNFLIF